MVQKVQLTLEQCRAYQRQPLHSRKAVYNFTIVPLYLWFHMPKFNQLWIVCYVFIGKNVYISGLTQFNPLVFNYNYNNAWFSHSVVSNSANPWTVAHQASLSTGFSRQEYWSGLPFPTPGKITWKKGKKKIEFVSADISLKNG